MIESIIIYFSIAIVTTFLASVSVSKKVTKEVKKIFKVLTIIVPSFFSGIRYGIGTDYVIYKNVFNEILNQVAITKRTEIGYELLNKIVIFFTSNFQVLLFVIAVITIGCVYSTLYRKKDKISVPFGMFAFMLMFYQMTFNLSRQMLAAAIVMYATRFLEKDNKKMYLVFIIIATSIHTSAIIGLPLIFLYNFLTEEKYRKKRLCFYFIVLAAVCGYSIILTPIFNAIPSLKYYSQYISYSYQGIGIGILRYILLGIAPGIYLYKRMKDDKPIMMMHAITILGFILWMNSYVSDYIAYRISYNFLLNIVFMLGYYWKNMKNKKEILINLLLLSIIIFFWYYDFFYLGAHETVPYTTIFSIL